MELSAAVLAGGASTRMGRDKAMLDHGGIPLADHIAAVLREVAAEVFVVAKAPLPGLRTPVVLDASPARTPLAGVSAALDHARHELVFVCACDMPTISPVLVRLLAEHIADAAAAVPVRDGRVESLHALWRREAAQEVARLLHAGERAVHRVLDALGAVRLAEREWRALDPEGRSFANLNTPADAAAMLR